MTSQSSALTTYGCASCSVWSRGALSLWSLTVVVFPYSPYHPTPFPSSCPLNAGFRPRGLCSFSIAAVKDHPKLSDLSQHAFVVVQVVSCVQLFSTSWTAACQASLSFTISQSWLKLMSIESMMPSNHLILCRPLLLPPSIFPSIRIFSNESVLRIRWPEY